MFHKFAICIPTFNRSSLLRLTIESVLKQTYLNYHIYIYDDCSTDNTEAISRSFDTPRISYIKNPSNVGMVANWNKAISSKKGELILILHDDDTLKPNFLEKYDQIFMNTQVHMAWSAVDIVDENGRFVRRNRPFSKSYIGVGVAEIVRHWKSYLPVKAPTVVVRNYIYESVGKFNTDFKYAMDYEMWFRIMKNYNVFYLDNPLLNYRVSRISNTLNMFNKDIISEFRMLVNNCFNRSTNFGDLNIKKLVDNYLFYFFLTGVYRIKVFNYDINLISECYSILNELKKFKNINFKLKIAYLILKRINNNGFLGGLAKLRKILYIS